MKNLLARMSHNYLRRYCNHMSACHFCIFYNICINQRLSNWRHIPALWPKFSKEESSNG